MKQTTSGSFTLLRARVEGLLNRDAEATPAFEKEAKELIRELSDRQAELKIRNEKLQIRQQQMKAEIAHFASFPEVSPNPIIEMDLSGTISYVNPSARKLFPDICTAVPSTPWVPDFESIVETFRGGANTIRHEIQIGVSWYERIVHDVVHLQLIRIYWVDITERKTIELRLAKDLAALTRLHELSTRVVEASGTKRMLQEIIDAAVEIVAAKRGTLQLLEDGSLPIVAHHGHEAYFIEAFAKMGNLGPVSREVLKHGARVVIEEVASSPLLGRTSGAQALKDSGAQALASTPISNRAGRLIGVLTTQWDAPYIPDEHDLRRIDLLARQAADLIEQMRTNEELRASHDELEQRVEKRTAELWQAYENLQRETDVRARLEEQLRQSHKMEAIGTLAGGIAHDFNNMLAIIMGNAELALDYAGEDIRGHLCRILDASKRSRDLVKQILTFSRKDRGKISAIKIVPVLRETYDMLRASLPSTIRMELDPRPKADMAVLADPSQIQQVIMNLANNAAHAMREKGGTLTIGLSTVSGQESPVHEGVEPGRYVKLTVKDTGTGISPEVQQRMYEPFFTTKEQGQGTGMGLAMVYGIVKNCGGTIEVESRVGKGSEFVIFLPQADLSSPEEEEQDEERAPSGSARRHVLFVDDESAIAEMAEVMIKRLGYDVTVVSDGMEAMKAFKESPDRFDLVITDQTMPEMTGVGLASKLLAVREDLPIILCTGYSDAVSSEKAKESGIREFVMKPVTKNELGRAIRRVLEREKTEEQIPPK